MHENEKLSNSLKDSEDVIKEMEMQLHESEQTSKELVE